MSDVLPDDQHIYDQPVTDQPGGEQRAGEQPGNAQPYPVPAAEPISQPPPVDAETTGVMAPYDGRNPSPEWVRPAPGSWEASLPAPATQSWAATSALPAQPPGPAVETVTCPECGAPAAVAVNRRDATDFCAKCDYPLFWTPSSVVQGNPVGANDMALRRLPGTVGRATIASLDCPHCAEPNTVTAQTCVRCGLPMVPVAEVPVPVPPPVYVPPPPPAYEPPKSHVAWWVWVLLYLAVAATVVVIVLVLTHRIR